MNHKLSRKIFNIGLLAAVAVALLGGIFIVLLMICIAAYYLVFGLVRSRRKAVQA